MRVAWDTFALERPLAFRAIAAALFIAAYIALDWVSVIEPFGNLGIAPWNPPAGLIFAFFLAQGWRFFAVSFAALVSADLLLRGVLTTTTAALASALIVALFYGAGASLLRRQVRISLKLDDHQDLLRLLAVAVGTSVLVAVTVMLVFAATDIVPWHDYSVLALRYWIGDVIGIAVFTPFILLLLDRERRIAAIRTWTALEAVLQIGAIVVALWIVFGRERMQHFEYAYLLFLPLIWIALRDGLMGATWGIVATQVGLIVATQIRSYDADIVTRYQLLMLAVAVTGLFLGAVVEERRRADLSLRWAKQHEAELAKAARLTTTGEMAAAIAHELNQPLTSAISFARACQGLLRADSAAARPDLRVQAGEMIDQAVQQIMRAGEIIRSAREFLQPGEMRRVRIWTSQLIRSAVDLARSDAAQNQVRIATRLVEDLPPVLADPIQIEQVLLNLMRNSIDAMTHGNAMKREIMIAAGRGDTGTVEIRVSDTGPGFPREVADRLFQPFATTKPGGMGLGLSISRSIVEAHGGRIWAVAGDGSGAEVRFVLPICDDDDDEADGGG